MRPAQRQQQGPGVWVAALLGSWQHDLVQRWKKDADAMVYEAPGPIAAWMNAERIARLAASLPAGLADRVLRNRWVDASEGCGYLTRGEAMACVELGRQMGLEIQFRAQPGREYFAAVDYGSVKDRTAMCVVHWDGDVLVVDRLDVLQGSKENRVRIEAVEEWMRDVSRDFNGPTFMVDQHQMESTIQRLQYIMRIERCEYRGGKTNYEMAVNLHTLVSNRRMAWPERAGVILLDGLPHTLVDEISELVVKHMVYGYRFDHQSGKHDDRAVSLGMASLLAVQRGKRRDFSESEFYF